MRVGSTEPIKVDVRVIASSNRKPEEAVGKGKLREDLLYRLNVFPIQLPTLTERAGDVDLLAEHFLTQMNREQGTSKKLTRPALERLRAQRWPGNVRELRNLLQRAFIMAEQDIGVDALPLSTEPPVGPGAANESSLRVKVGTSIAEAERQLILATLQHYEGDKKRTAEVLRISLKTLYNRLSVYKGPDHSRGRGPSE
jgi:DNA-binding NtrC family response regulator